MSDPRVKTVFEADNRGQQEAIAGLQAAMERLRETNQRLAAESHRHHEIDEMFHTRVLEWGREQVDSVRGSIAEYFTLTSAIELAAKARERLTELTKEAASERLGSSQSLVGMLRDAGQIQHIGAFERAFEEMPGRDEDKLRRFQESLQVPFLPPQQYVENAKAASNLGAYTDTTGAGELLGQIGYMAPNLSPEQRSRLTVEALKQSGTMHDELLSGMRDPQFRRLLESGAFPIHGVAGGMGLASALLQAGGTSRDLSAIEALLTEKIAPPPAAPLYPSSNPSSEPVDPKLIALGHLRDLSAAGRFRYLREHPEELEQLFSDTAVPRIRDALNRFPENVGQYENALERPIPRAPNSPVLKRVEEHKKTEAEYSASTLPYADEGEFREEFFGEKGKLETVWNKYFANNPRNNAARRINEMYTWLGTALSSSLNETDVDMLNLKAMTNREQDSSGPLHQLFSEALGVLREIRDRTPTQEQIIQKWREAHPQANHGAAQHTHAPAPEAKAANATATQRE